jgi:hypothetical protein
MECLPRFLSCVAVGGLMIGCAPATPPAAPPPPPRPAAAAHDHEHDHDHGDHDEPETVAEGLAQLEKLCADVKAHLAAGDHEKADGPVHMVGHLLEELGELVAKEKPAADAEAKQALEAIFESFDKLDTVIHGADEEARKKLDYAEHAPAIEAALAKLKDLTQK